MDNFYHHIKQFCWEYSLNKYLKVAHQTQIPAFLLFNLKNVSPNLLHQLLGLLKSSYNHGHNILMLDQIFFSSQVKRSAIISYKHGNMVYTSLLTT